LVKAFSCLKVVPGGFRAYLIRSGIDYRLGTTNISRQFDSSAVWTQSNAMPISKTRQFSKGRERLVAVPINQISSTRWSHSRLLSVRKSRKSALLKRLNASVSLARRKIPALEQGRKSAARIDPPSSQRGPAIQSIPDKNYDSILIEHAPGAKQSVTIEQWTLDVAISGVPGFKS
jgi:hypothetical protein